MKYLYNFNFFKDNDGNREFGNRGGGGEDRTMKSTFFDRGVGFSSKFLFVSYLVKNILFFSYFLSDFSYSEIVKNWSSTGTPGLTLDAV